MSENENILTCEVNSVLNDRQVDDNGIERRFAITTENEVDELVSNAQAQSTKMKTIYAVNIFKGTCMMYTQCQWFI